MKLTVEQIAEVCHEANRSITRIIADLPVQPLWAEAPEEMRSSTINGVEYAIAHPHATPEDQHAAWVAHKLDSGWTYGPVKNDVSKTHPMLVPFADVPAGTRHKDALFRAVVAALSRGV